MMSSEHLHSRVKHVPKRKVELAGRPAGEALSALWYLGKEEVTPEVIEQIEERLSEEAFAELTRKQNIMPGWMREAFREYQEERAVA